ncbi:MAG: amine oxidase [Gammaproteobacteria bacterium]
MSDNKTLSDMDEFKMFVTGMKSSIKRHYDRGINRDLSQQNWQNLFKRNVTGVLQQAYDDALKELKQLSFEQGDNVLAIEALTSFDGFIEELLDYAIQKHRTSCALSNFPDEHNPSPQYINEVLEQVEKDWKGFVAVLTAIHLRV